MSLLTEVYPCNESVRIVSVLGVLDVDKADDVHLGRTSPSRRVDREKDRPCDQTSNEAQSHRDLKVSQEEETVKGLMIEDVAIWRLVECADPIE